LESTSSDKEIVDKGKKMISWKKVFYGLTLFVVAGIAGLTGAIAGGIAMYQAGNHLQPTAIATQSIQPIESPVEGSIVETSPVVTTEHYLYDIETPITKAVEKIGPAVVTVLGTIPGQETVFGLTPDQPVSGSGVIISEQGYILTNNHVIENTVEVHVIFADGREEPAQIIGGDDFSDIAVLKVDGKIPSIAPIGNSDDLKPGETAIAIGSPLGDFKNTVTVGVISGIGRSIEVNENYQMEGLIQTDAAINQGNSGGPLVNLAGEVVGINTLIVRGNGYGSAVAEGLGFAIPANTVQAISRQLIENGYVSYPYLGVRWQWITPSIAYRYGLTVESGAYISSIAPNSPAAVAGLQAGDIIIKIGDRLLNDDHPFINVLYDFSAGETTALEFVREQENLKIQVTFGEHPTP
jgi:2-alkenal reductase